LCQSRRSALEYEVAQLKRLKNKESNIMAISKILANITQYISEAAMRIFGPTDDAYPVIGVQPFTGEPYDKHTTDTW
jgi:hypothetical protein